MAINTDSWRARYGIRRVHQRIRWPDQATPMACQKARPPIFGSWACTADGTGGFSSHLITPNLPKSKTRSQLADIRESVDLDEKRVPPELDSDNPGNVTTQNQTLSLVEFDTNSDFKKPYFSKTLGKYLKVIRCSSLRGGGGELGTNKNLDLWLQLVCTKLKLKHAI